MTITTYFDGHNDLLMQLWLQHPENPEHYFFRTGCDGHLDFSRIRQGRLGGIFCSLRPAGKLCRQAFSTAPWGIK